jgi:hypothetical protein
LNLVRGRTVCHIVVRRTVNTAAPWRQTLRRAGPVAPVGRAARTACMVDACVPSAS